MNETSKENSAPSMLDVALFMQAVSKKAELGKTTVLDCPICGAAGSVSCTKSPNTHLRASCSSCGISVMH